MTVKELVNHPDYRFYHSAMKQGYVSRKSEGIVEPYKGRYGEGYVLLSPRWDTTRYCTISYYIKRK